MDRPQPHGPASLVDTTTVMDTADMDTKPETNELDGWVLRGYSAITDELEVEVPLHGHSGASVPVDYPIADGLHYFIEHDG